MKPFILNLLLKIPAIALLIYGLQVDVHAISSLRFAIVVAAAMTLGSLADSLLHREG